MFVLRLFYQRHRKMVMRLGAFLAFGLTALALTMPTPRADAGAGEAVASVSVVPYAARAARAGDLVDLLAHERLADARFGRLSFNAPDRPL